VYKLLKRIPRKTRVNFGPAVLSSRSSLSPSLSLSLYISPFPFLFVSIVLLFFSPSISSRHLIPPPVRVAFWEQTISYWKLIIECFLICSFTYLKTPKIKGIYESVLSIDLGNDSCSLWLRFIWTRYVVNDWVVVPRHMNATHPYDVYFHLIYIHLWLRPIRDIHTYSCDIYT